MSSINNMSIKMFNAAANANTHQAKAVEKVGVNNLDLYIPRIDEKYSEDEIKFIFADTGIGLVNYVDFVATKDPETKQIKYYSAFLKLSEWNPDGFWFNKIMVEKQNKIQISRFEFWILLPAKTPLSRSKVNIHQLASYTDELFVRVEAIEKKVDPMTISLEQFQNLLAKSETQATQIEQLLKIVQIQAEQLNRVNEVLFKKQVEEETTIKRPRALTIEDLNQDQDQKQNKCEICSMEFDTEKQLHFHSSVCKKETPLTSHIPDDDDCFLSKTNPKPKPLTFQNCSETVHPTQDIISGSFSVDFNEILEFVAKDFKITKKEAKKQLEKEWSNNRRVKSSKNFCGNA